MSERPILFSGPMVRALLAGTKTQTRRVLQVGSFARKWLEDCEDTESGAREFVADPGNYPPFVAGDRLWVREAWAAHWMYDDVKPTLARSERDELRPTDNRWYAADPDGTTGSAGCPADGRRGKWRPSIHMPRWASRILLDVTEVRVQRLQEISEEDARAEGVQAHERAVPGHEYRANLRALWDEINAKRAPWASNPWVWCVSFKRADHD